MNTVVDYEPVVHKVALRALGGEMAALEFGPSERPVDIVFSHANGFNARTYRTILAPLAGDLRILAVDLRGHGASSLPTTIERGDRWAEFRDDLLAFLAVVADRPVVLAGHSLGATTSLLAAAAEPARVKALALFDPPLSDDVDNSHTPEATMAAGALRRRAVFPDRATALASYTGRGAFRTWRPEQLADYVRAGLRETADGEVALICAPAWEASTFSARGHDPWAAFRATRCPIRILRAEHEPATRLDPGEIERLATGRISVETVPGTTHFLPMEQPALVRATLLDLVG